MKKTWLLAFALLVIFACNKDENNPVALRILLTDGPGDFQQVNIDIEEVRIKTSSDTSQWLTLNTYAGIYDLLLLQNGVDTLLVTDTLPPVTIQEVRFILGNDNTVMVDSVLYPLSTPSAQQSGLKIKVDKALNLDVNTLVFDFDAAASILQTGNGSYLLKPVIKVK